MRPWLGSPGRPAGRRGPVTPNRETSELSLFHVGSRDRHTFAPTWVTAEQSPGQTCTCTSPGAAWSPGKKGSLRSLIHGGRGPRVNFQIEPVPAAAAPPASPFPALTAHVKPLIEGTCHLRKCPPSSANLLAFCGVSAYLSQGWIRAGLCLVEMQSRSAHPGRWQQSHPGRNLVQAGVGFSKTPGLSPHSGGSSFTLNSPLSSFRPPPAVLSKQEGGVAADVPPRAPPSPACGLKTSPDPVTSSSGPAHTPDPLFPPVSSAKRRLLSYHKHALHPVPHPRHSPRRAQGRTPGGRFCGTDRIQESWVPQPLSSTWAFPGAEDVPSTRPQCLAQSLRMPDP